MGKVWSEVLAHRELIGILVSRNIKIRYKHSALGFLWTLLGPLFMIVIYFLFLSVMKFEIDLPSLVAGILVWQFLAMCLGDALHAVLGNANLVTKASFPRVVLPLSTVLANTINFLLSMVVLLVYLLIVKADFGALYWFPVVALTQFALCLGMALIISTANVFFRDTEHIVSLVMMAWFFMSPIIYPITLIVGGAAVPGQAEPTTGFPAWIQHLYFLNPMAGIVTAYRNLFISQDAVPVHLWGASFAAAWLILGLGVWVFQRTEPRFGDEL